MRELKLCPLCGGENARLDCDAERVLNGQYGHFVECNDCFAASGYCKTEEEAIESWNRRANGWIPVEERLPESEIEALVYSPSCKKIFMAFYHKEIWMFTHDHCPIYEQISYWMPLPGLPEGVKRDE